ncbi:MAG: hypothetical protein ACK4KW_07685 [Gemmobacter sp.]
MFRILLLMALLPGLVTGILPLPGAAAGFAMDICADGGPVTVRLDAEGGPRPDTPCEDCCLVCGPGPLALPAPMGAVGLADGSHVVRLPAATELPAPARFLLSRPRGPPVRI